MWVGMTKLCPYYDEFHHHKSYSVKSLFGFRSLFHQWGEDVVVGSLEESRQDGHWVRRSTYDALGTEEEEWSFEEEVRFPNLFHADIAWETAEDEESQQKGHRESNMYEASDKVTNEVSDRDSDRKNAGDDEADSDDDSDGGDSDEGGCRLE